MNKMTLPSRHKIQNSGPGGLRPSTDPTVLDLYEWAEKKHFVSLKLGGQGGVRTRDLWLSKRQGPRPNHCETEAEMPMYLYSVMWTLWNLHPLLKFPGCTWYLSWICCWPSGSMEVMTLRVSQDTWTGSRHRDWTVSRGHCDVIQLTQKVTEVIHLTGKLVIKTNTANIGPRAHPTKNLETQIFLTFSHFH